MTSEQKVKAAHSGAFARLANGRWYICPDETGWKLLSAGCDSESAAWDSAVEHKSVKQFWGQEWLKLKCPKCGASPFVFCDNNEGRHHERILLARERWMEAQKIAKPNRELPPAQSAPPAPEAEKLPPLKIDSYKIRAEFQDCWGEDANVAVSEAKTRQRESELLEALRTISTLQRQLEEARDELKNAALNCDPRRERHDFIGLHEAITQAEAALAALSVATSKAGELKPCPFCGGAASIGEIRCTSSPNAHWSDGTECLHSFFGSCVACGSNTLSLGIGQQTRDKAIAAWNRRAPEVRE